MADDKSFWDHAEDLRHVLLRVLALYVAVAAATFTLMPRIFDAVILAPCRADFAVYRFMDMLGLDVSAAEISLVNIRLASQFFIHISSSLWLALVIALPLMLRMLWGFVVPGLYESERRAGALACFSGTLLFYLGMLTGYFLVFPLTLRFLADYQLSALVPNTLSLDSYIDNFMMLILMMGLVFELPALVWLLGRLGVLDRARFASLRRHAIVGLLVLAAVITPTGDPFTLLVVFTPLYLLWEASTWVLPKPQPVET